jgi:hypothetical protein
MAGAKLANMQLHDNQHTKEDASIEASSLPPISQAAAAKIMNVSRPVPRAAVEAGRCRLTPSQNNSGPLAGGAWNGRQWVGPTWPEEREHVHHDDAHDL